MLGSFVQHQERAGRHGAPAGALLSSPGHRAPPELRFSGAGVVASRPVPPALLALWAAALNATEGTLADAAPVPLLTPLCLHLPAAPAAPLQPLPGRNQRELEI